MTVNEVALNLPPAFHFCLIVLFCLLLLLLLFPFSFIGVSFQVLWGHWHFRGQLGPGRHMWWLVYLHLFPFFISPPIRFSSIQSDYCYSWIDIYHIYHYFLFVALFFVFISVFHSFSSFCGFNWAFCMIPFLFFLLSTLFFWCLS